MHTEGDRIVHPKLGEVTRVVSGDDVFLVKDFIMENEQSYSEYLREIQILLNDHICRESLLLPVDSTFKQTQYCGSGGVARVVLISYS